MAHAAVSQEFHYRISWRARGSQPGAHAGPQTGSGFEFQNLVGLLDARDARRFDLRASLRDPHGELRFRNYTQTSAVPVYALVDVSASMGFAGRGRKLDALADFVAALGYSAFRTGDPAAVFACDSMVRQDLYEPLRWTRTAGQKASAGLRDLSPAGRSSDGLLTAARLCARRRALVFLLSDFHFPLALLREILATLAIHHVVPVVLWDDAEIDLPRFGLATVRDLETGAERIVFLRPAFRARLQHKYARRSERLAQCFATFGLTPLSMGCHFDAAAVTRYFYA